MLFCINCFGIELVLCDLYLTRFDLIKDILFDTFFIKEDTEIKCLTYKICVHWQ